MAKNSEVTKGDYFSKNISKDSTELTKDINKINLLKDAGCLLCFSYFLCRLFNHVYLKIDSYMTIHSVKFIVKTVIMINDSSEFIDSYCY